MTDEDKIKIYERYKDDGIPEEATRLLLGEEFDILHEDTENSELPSRTTPANISYD